MVLLSMEADLKVELGIAVILDEGQRKRNSRLTFNTGRVPTSFASKVMGHVRFGFAAGCEAEAMPRR